MRYNFAIFSLVKLLIMKYLIKSIVVAVALTGVVTLAGCASTTNKTNALSLGMSKAEVVSVMGEPANTRAAKGIEYMIYDLKESAGVGHAVGCVGASVVTFGIGAVACKRGRIPYFVALQDGKVSAYGKVGDFDSTKDPAVDIDLDIE